MRIADYVLQKTLITNGVPQQLWTGLRRLMVQAFNDPPCSIQHYGRTLKLPLSHELPAYLRLLPFYDSLLHRLSAYLHKKHNSIKCVDIGANIGDTIAAIYQSEKDLFLAIEPDPKFHRYLHDNWNVPNVKILDLVCSSRSGVEKFEIDQKFGTASFHENILGKEFRTITLDDLLTDHMEFAKTDLIKVDTDGNDFEVISGAKQTLLNQPAFLFECDVFGNAHYVEDCLDTISLFNKAGYKSMLVYEKFGYPMGRYELRDLIHFRDLLFYQLTKKYIYFDVLLMREDDLLPFYALEKSFFLDTLYDPSLRPTAEKV